MLNQISSWARESLKIIDDYADFSLKARIFNEYFMKKKDNVQPEHYFTSQLGTKIGSLQPTRKLIKGSISETTIKDVPSVNINEKFSSPEGEVKSSNKNEKMDEEK